MKNDDPEYKVRRASDRFQMVCIPDNLDMHSYITLIELILDFTRKNNSQK